MAGDNHCLTSTVTLSRKRTLSSPWTPAPCPRHWSTRSALWVPCWVCMLRNRCAAHRWLQRSWSAGNGCRRTFSAVDYRCCSPTTALMKRRERPAVPAPTHLVRHGLWVWVRVMSGLFLGLGSAGSVWAFSACTELPQKGIYNNKDVNHLRKFPPGVPVNTWHISSTKGTFSKKGCPQLHIHPPFQAHLTRQVYVILKLAWHINPHIHLHVGFRVHCCNQNEALRVDVVSPDEGK